MGLCWQHRTAAEALKSHGLELVSTLNYIPVSKGGPALYRTGRVQCSKQQAPAC